MWTPIRVIIDAGADELTEPDESPEDPDLQLRLYKQRAYKRLLVGYPSLEVELVAEGGKHRAQLEWGVSHSFSFFFFVLSNSYYSFIPAFRGSQERSPKRYLDRPQRPQTLVSIQPIDRHDQQELPRLHQRSNRTSPLPNGQELGHVSIFILVFSNHDTN